MAPIEIVDKTGSECKAQQVDDVVLLHGRTQHGLRALRARRNQLELAELRPLSEGRPIPAHSEVVKLEPRPESPLLWNVEVQYRAGEEHAEEPGEGSRASGPPQVSTERYRRNWELIFRKGAAGDDSSSLN